MIKEIVKGMWQFVRFLFVPRWGRAQRGGGTAGDSKP